MLSTASVVCRQVAAAVVGVPAMATAQWRPARPAGRMSACGPVALLPGFLRLTSGTGAGRVSRVRGAESGRQLGGGAGGARVPLNSGPAKAHGPTSNISPPFGVKPSAARITTPSISRSWASIRLSEPSAHLKPRAWFTEWLRNTSTSPGIYLQKTREVGRPLRVGLKLTSSTGDTGSWGSPERPVGHTWPEVVVCWWRRRSAHAAKAARFGRSSLPRTCSSCFCTVRGLR